jgi:hypothetical protein
MLEEISFWCNFLEIPYQEQNMQTLELWQIEHKSSNVKAIGHVHYNINSYQEQLTIFDYADEQEAIAI